MATFTSGQLAGIIVGSMIGTLFLVTCIVSAVKAVKDRREIKARIAEKRKAKAFASKLKKDGKLQTAAESTALSIEDPGYFARNNLTNNHRVVSHSNSCPGRSTANGSHQDPRGRAAAEHDHGKRFSDPTYQRGASNNPPWGGPTGNARKGRQVSADLLNVGVYRYKGDFSNGVENAAFEMKESPGSQNEVVLKVS
ncbi:uncharacterized protein LOC135468788 [Liolophura sinensis]|uniref:uncharacterized protein LOC135468788 n=1 Tax=Liolophura sinensis TaxID=3198878 RepID=UPI003158348C